MKTNYFSILMVLVILMTVAATPSTAYIDERVGGLDPDQYCRAISATHHVKDASQGETGLGCQFDAGGPIKWLSKSDLDAACTIQYGNDAYAARDGSSDPDAWYCKGPSAGNNNGGRQRVGGIDFDAYCRTIGATNHLRDDSKGVWGIGCQYGAGGSIIWLNQSNLDSACVRQYNSDTYAATEGNKPYDWYCATGGGQEPQPNDPQAPPSSNNNEGPENNNNQNNNNGNGNAVPKDTNPNNTPNNQNDGSKSDACVGYTKQHISGQSSPPSGQYLTTEFSDLLLRNGHNQNKCTYGWLVASDYYPILDERDGWYKVQAGNYQGWVMGQYVSVYLTSTDNNNIDTASNSQGNDQDDISPSKPQPLPGPKPPVIPIPTAIIPEGWCRATVEDIYRVWWPPDSSDWLDIVIIVKSPGVNRDHQDRIRFLHKNQNGEFRDEPVDFAFFGNDQWKYSIGSLGNSQDWMAIYKSESGCD